MEDNEEEYSTPYATTETIAIRYAIMIMGSILTKVQSQADLCLPHHAITIRIRDRYQDGDRDHGRDRDKVNVYHTMLSQYG